MLRGHQGATGQRWGEAGKHGPELNRAQGTVGGFRMKEKGPTTMGDR